MSPRRMLARSFAYGVYCAMAGVGLYQDTFTKEEYIEHIENYWWDLPWWIWLLPLLYFLLCQMGLMARVSKYDPPNDGGSV